MKYDIFFRLDFEKGERDVLITKFLMECYDNNYEKNDIKNKAYIKNNINYINSKRKEFIEKLINDIKKLISDSIDTQIDINLDSFQKNLHNINIKNIVEYIEEINISNSKLKDDSKLSKDKLKKYLEKEITKLNAISDLIYQEDNLSVKEEISNSLKELSLLNDKYINTSDKDKTKSSEDSSLNFDKEDSFIKELSNSLKELKLLREQFSNDFIEDKTKMHLISDKESLINKKISFSLKELKLSTDSIYNDFKEKDTIFSIDNNLITNLINYISNDLCFEVMDNLLASFLYDIILSCKNKKLTTKNLNVIWIIGNDSLSQNDDRVLSSIMDNCTNKNQLFIIAGTNEDILHSSYKCCNYIFLNSQDEAFYRKLKINFTKKSDDNKTIEFKIVNYNQEKSFKQFYFNSNLKKKFGLDLNNIEL